MSTTFLGYLDNPYLEDNYLEGQALFSMGMQVNRVFGFTHAPCDPGYLEESYLLGDYLASTSAICASGGMQINLQPVKALGMQIDRQPTGIKANGMQVERFINNLPKEIGQQAERLVSNTPKANGMQVERFINNQNKPVGMEIRRDKSWPHWQCGGSVGYLTESYLVEDYLTESDAGYCVQGPMQVERFINNTPKILGQQAERKITSSKILGMQVERFIDNTPKEIGMQVDRSFTKILGMQIRIVLYNTTNLRIMCDFPSRGTTGTNWTATSTETGDFSPNNLNTDIVEQVWRSVATVTSATVSCDTEIVQGTSIDTLAILNHNFTTSASVTLEGSNDAFASTPFSLGLTVTEDNLYYIAPAFPGDQFRYWRFVISDPTNGDNYLQIGTIVFGNAIILQGECFVDQVIRRSKHFADKVPTEGFTNVSNDRALKNSVQLEFRNLLFDGGNFENLREVFETARTSLKCLWIPDPQDVKRFAIFGKLTNIPEERHVNMGSSASDTVDFILEVDESL